MTCNNCCPICKLLCFWESLESPASIWLKALLLEHSILDPDQCGFRASQSTIAAVTLVLNDLNTGLDNKKHRASIFLYFAEGFCTVYHSFTSSAWLLLVWCATGIRYGPCPVHHLQYIICLFHAWFAKYIFYADDTVHCKTHLLRVTLAVTVKINLFSVSKDLHLNLNIPRDKFWYWELHRCLSHTKYIIVEESNGHKDSNT